MRGEYYLEALHHGGQLLAVTEVLLEERVVGHLLLPRLLGEAVHESRCPRPALPGLGLEAGEVLGQVLVHLLHQLRPLLVTNLTSRHLCVTRHFDTFYKIQ